MTLGPVACRKWLVPSVGDFQVCWGVGSVEVAVFGNPQDLPVPFHQAEPIHTIFLLRHILWPGGSWSRGLPKPLSRDAIQYHRGSH